MYLKDYYHIDSEISFPYKTTRVYVHNGRIVCDRELVGTGDARPTARNLKPETIHAMDVVLFTLVSNPLLQNPLIRTGNLWHPL